MSEFHQVFNKVSGLQGWLSKEVAELLYDKAMSSKSLGPVVEIGSWHGRSTIVLSEAIGDCSSLYAIDPHCGSQEHQHLYSEVDTYQILKDNLNKYSSYKNVEIIKEFSNQASHLVPDEISMLWVDGSHEYKDVKADFDLYFSKIKAGGWILFHDSKWQGVKKVLWEDIYTNPNLSLVRRIEDTTYARVLEKPNKLFFVMNRLHLKYLKWKQEQKRKRRKRNKQKKASN